MNRKGQNIVEYILLVVAVVLVFLVFLKKQNPYHQSIKGMLNSTLDQIDNKADKITFQ